MRLDLYLIENQVPIRVERVESRNKKTRRNENKKAQYCVGSRKEKVFIRLLHGLIVARDIHHDTWMPFADILSQ